MNNVAVVVVHFGDPSITMRCLDSIPKNVTRYVIDNGGNYLNESDSIIIRPPHNLFYWGAIKYAISELDQEFIFITNNDIIYNESLSEFFLDSIQYKSLGAIGVKLYEANGNTSGRILALRSGWIRILFWRLVYLNYTLGCLLLLFKELVKPKGKSSVNIQNEKFGEVDAIHGHAFLLNRKFWHGIEGTAPLWGEELYLELHALKNGLKFHLYNTPVGVHQHSANTSNISSKAKYLLQKRAFKEAYRLWKKYS